MQAAADVRSLYSGVLRAHTPAPARAPPTKEEGASLARPATFTARARARAASATIAPMTTLPISSPNLRHAANPSSNVFLEHIRGANRETRAKLDAEFNAPFMPEII